MPATTDTLAPGYAWVPPRLAAARAADAQDAIDARHVAANAELMALCDWLGETWDSGTTDSADEEATRAENIARAVRDALAPWKAEALAYIRAQRAAHGMRAELLLFGERV